MHKVHFDKVRKSYYVFRKDSYYENKSRQYISDDEAKEFMEAAEAMAKMTPKTISLSAKCSDLCTFQILSENGTTMAETNDYVPHDMGVGGGDYVELDIDIETGKILNWDAIKPSEDTLKAFIGNNEDDE